MTPPANLGPRQGHGTLSLTLSYLHCVFLMFRIAPRASAAGRVYRATTPPDEQRPRRGFSIRITDRYWFRWSGPEPRRFGRRERREASFQAR